MPNRHRHTVFLALGGNLKHPPEPLIQAVQALRSHAAISDLTHSRWRKTLPVNCPEGSPAFYNGVLRLKTSLSIDSLWDLCQALEREAGRLPPQIRGKNTPRALDIDLLFYDEQVLHTPVLQVPHPRLHERDFVLLPFLELAPDWQHPVFKTSMATLAQRRGGALESSSVVERLVSD